MIFNVVIEPRALADIQDAINYYDEQQTGLGERFKRAVNTHIGYLYKNPFFQITYSDYRVLPVKKFPFIILFYFDENTATVFVSAIFNTYQDTGKYPK